MSDFCVDLQGTGSFFRPLLDGSEDEIWSHLRDGVILRSETSYFDFTASGLPYRAIEERLATLLPYYANTHSEYARHARLMSSLYEQARIQLRRHLELSEDFVLLPAGQGATGAIKKFQELLGIYIPPKTRQRIAVNENLPTRPLVILGPYEHHSNELSYREGFSEVIRVPLDSRGGFDLEVFEQLLKKHRDREIIVTLSIASNVTGIIAPYEEISKRTRLAGGIVALDAANASSCLQIPSDLYDALFLAPHKLLGGVGSCGLLVIRKALVDSSLPPTFAGGGTVRYVSRSSQVYADVIEAREDAGTPNVFALLRAALAYQLRNEIGLERIRARVSALRRLLIDSLTSLPGVVIYGEEYTGECVGTVALNFSGISPYWICETLSYEYRMETRAGCSCAGPYGHDLLGLADQIRPFENPPGWLRVSLHYTHTQEQVHSLVNALSEIIKRKVPSDLIRESHLKF